MAGIGFELRKLLRSESFSGLLRAYGFAGAIGSGPWLLSILSIIAIGVLGVGQSGGEAVVRFQVSVTYLIAGSLILTGFLQLLFSRFIADRLFEDREDSVLPNLLGALTVTTLLSGCLGALLLVLFFRQQPPRLSPDQWVIYRVLMLASFVTLSDIWILVVLLSGLKAYRKVLLGFSVGYGITVVAALALRSFGLDGLLGGFLLGHAVLFFILLALVLHAYPGKQLVSFDFSRKSYIFPSLGITGLIYNLAIWADKIIFWFNPSISSSIIGPLRASVIYDVPIFLAYLSIVPGMGVFLVRIETDFAEQYDAFYTAVREGDTLAHIERVKDSMVYTVRQGIYEIFKVQGLTVVVLFLLGARLLQTIHISPLYVHLFYVDLVAAGVQVLLLAILNIFFYLDQRIMALCLSLLFAVTNAGFTLLTQALGPAYYGYGFAASVVVTSLVGLALLSRKLDRLEYETFMLQQTG